MPVITALNTALPTVSLMTNAPTENLGGGHVLAA
jgi:hypothetical protein